MVQQECRSFYCAMLKRDEPYMRRIISREISHALSDWHVVMSAIQGFPLYFNGFSLQTRMAQLLHVSACMLYLTRLLVIRINEPDVTPPPNLGTLAQSIIVMVSG